MEKLTTNLKGIFSEHSNDIRLFKQFVYDFREELNNLDGSIDIADDNAIMKMEGLFHRYPTKVLIFPTESCFGECRFCFRKHIRQNKILSKEDFSKIIQYIASNKEITEVIFSGGDPMTLNNDILFEMISKVRNITSVKIIRIHTRVLTYSPERINKEFIDFIKTVQPLYMVFHINSAIELSSLACNKANELANNGIFCMSQTALLHEVNDTVKDLEELFTKLITLRIKPYYLFHPDRVKGNDHFYVRLNKGIDLYKSLFNYISGLAMPIYLLNIPNGGGHCIIDLSNVIKQSKNEYILTDWEDNTHKYSEEGEIL